MAAVKDRSAVVVGVGSHGLGSGTGALVAEVARQLGLDIELVHAVPLVLGSPTASIEAGIALEQLEKAGRSILATSVDQVRGLVGPQQAVTGRLIHGGVVPCLVERSQDAQLVVLERHDHGQPRWDRLVGGGTVARVAARAHAPVVVVPAGWEPSSAARLPITVGCEESQRAAAELWTAFGLAAATDRSVRVVRVTYLPEAYQEILRREMKHEEFLDGILSGLRRDAAVPVSVSQGVPCELEARWGHPADELVDLSAASSLLVLGRRDPRLPFASHLGPVVATSCASRPARSWSWNRPCTSRFGFRSPSVRDDGMTTRTLVTRGALLAAATHSGSAAHTTSSDWTAEHDDLSARPRLATKSGRSSDEVVAAAVRRYLHNDPSVSSQVLPLEPQAREM